MNRLSRVLPVAAASFAIVNNHSPNATQTVLTFFVEPGLGSTLLAVFVAEYLQQRREARGTAAKAQA